MVVIDFLAVVSRYDDVTCYRKVIEIKGQWEGLKFLDLIQGVFVFVYVGKKMR